ncbi:MAG: hypothetical protein U0821_11340 [Chloroflexota bacterium]
MQPPQSGRVDRPFDSTLRELVRADARAWVRLAGWTDVASAELLDSNVSSVRAEVDAAVLVSTSSADTWVLHLEFQTSPDPALPRRLHDYNRLLAHQHGRPVVSAVVLLRPAAASKSVRGRYMEHWPDGRLALLFRYQVIRAWTLPTEAFLDGPLALAPLAVLPELFRTGISPAERIDRVRWVIEQIRARQNQDPDAARERLVLAATFFVLGLRYRADDARRLLGGAREMRDSLTYQAVLEEGRAAGVAQGVEQGAAQGRRAEARRFTLRIGERRFGAPPSAVVARLEAMTEVDEIERIGLALLTASSWAAAFEG